MILPPFGRVGVGFHHPFGRVGVGFSNAVATALHCMDYRAKSKTSCFGLQ